MNTLKIDSKQTKIIAHRGLSGIERENTCPAFVAAANRSYFGIETDVHVSKDGKFVLIHDETTDKASGGKYSINVEESNYDDFKDIVLPDSDGTYIRRDIRIPLLCEYIQICKKYNKACITEIKNSLGREELIGITEEFKKADYLGKVIFISFDLKNCLILRELLPQNRVQWIIGNVPVTGKLAETLSDNKLDIDIYYKRLTRENIEFLHSRGIKVNCWTCDDKDAAERLAEWGVDFITTNMLE